MLPSRPSSVVPVGVALTIRRPIRGDRLASYKHAVVERGDLVFDRALLTGTEDELVCLVRPRLETQLEQREPGAVVAGQRHRVDERDARDLHRARAEPALVADVRDQIGGVELAVETEALGDVGHGASSLRRLNQKKPRPANVRR